MRQVQRVHELVLERLDGRLVGVVVQGEQLAGCSWWLMPPFLPPRSGGYGRSHLPLGSGAAQASAAAPGWGAAARWNVR